MVGSIKGSVVSVAAKLWRGSVGAVLFGFKVFRRLCMWAIRPMFRRCGRRVIFNPFDSFSYSTISIGEHVFIGQGAIFHATESTIKIGDKVMFGPRVTIMGGDHNSSELGRFMIDVKRKRPSDDRAVVIEDDVWVGSGAVILKGVVVGRGSIVAAGSVVTRSIPEFSIAAGVPAKVIGRRFDDEHLGTHKRLLGLEE